MEPKLSLEYNSQSGNGLLGMGWSLGGLSAIARCPRTLAQDGVKGGINYDSNDRYCLDGQRMMAISGIYGANGTEYRTERESFARIISYATAGNGPSWFKVWTKSGQIMEFGNTTDSKVEAQGKTTVSVYSLNKISDTKGNYLTVTYNEDIINGNFTPARIDYTGNSTTSAATTNSVQFVYQVRTDVAPVLRRRFGHQDRESTHQRQDYSGAALVKDYRVSYDNSGSTMRSKIASVKECSGDGSSCLSATTFGWQHGIDGLFVKPDLNNLTNTVLSHSNGSVGSLLGDFNGDGRTDILRWSDDYAQNILLLGNGESYFTQPANFNIKNTYLSNSSHTFGSLLGDFNGDGRTDIVRWSDQYQDNVLYLSNGDGSFTQAPAFNIKNTNLSHSNHSVGSLLGDFDGDGRTDIVRWSDQYQNNALYLSNGDGSFTQAPSFNIKNTYLSLGNTTLSLLADFNGDRQDGYPTLDE